MATDKRFQHQAWYVKVWRYRHYLSVPPRAWSFYWADRRNEDPQGWSCAWNVAIGEAQAEMDWTYTWEEVKEDLGWDEDDESVTRIRRLADYVQGHAHTAERSLIPQDDEMMRESDYEFYRGRASAFRQIETELREMAEAKREIP